MVVGENEVPENGQKTKHEGDRWKNRIGFWEHMLKNEHS